MPDQPPPTPEDLYARHLADERAQRYPSALRALALTVADLDRQHPAPDALQFGAAVRRALAACRDTTGGPQ
jgi:hypothetical protein